MKTLQFIIIGILALAIENQLLALNVTKTETIKVWGNCESCKTRIEKAAKIQGVSKATWDKNTKMLTLSYDPSVVKSDDIQKKIASVGHDTEKFKADDKAYNNLPGCCQYERKK